MSEIREEEVIESVGVETRASLNANDRCDVCGAQAEVLGHFIHRTGPFVGFVPSLSRHGRGRERAEEGDRADPEHRRLDPVGAPERAVHCLCQRCLYRREDPLLPLCRLLDQPERRAADGLL